MWLCRPNMRLFIGCVVTARCRQRLLCPSYPFLLLFPLYPFLLLCPSFPFLLLFPLHPFLLLKTPPLHRGCLMKDESHVPYSP